MNEPNLRFIQELEREIKAEEKTARQKKREINRKRCNPVHIGAVAMLIASLCAVPVMAQTISGLNLLRTYAPYDTVVQKDILDAIYPVGKIYISTQNINPATQFGGTWAAIGQGRVLVGQGGSYAVGDIGGSVDGSSSAAFVGTASGVGGTITLNGTASGVGAGAAITGSTNNVSGNFSGTTNAITLGLTNLPVHAHSITHTHTFDHTHTYQVAGSRIGNPNGATDHAEDGIGHQYFRGNLNLANNRNTSTYTGNSGTSTAGTTGSAGSGSSFTLNSASGSGSGLSGSVSLNLPAAGLSGTAAVTGTASGLSGAATASGNVTDKTMQPYIAVYMWERTG